jgi:hypothetical protein
MANLAQYMTAEETKELGVVKSQAGMDSFLARQLDHHKLAC